MTETETNKNSSICQVGLVALLHHLLISIHSLSSRSLAALLDLKILKQLITIRKNIAQKINGYDFMVATFTFSFHQKHCKNFRLLNSTLV